MACDNNPFVGVSIFLFGVVVGGAAALMAGTDKDGKTRPEVQKKIKESKLKLIEGGRWAQARTGELVDYAEEFMAGAKKQLAQKLAELRDKYGQIDKTKYAQAVQEVVEQMRATSGVTVAQAKTLSKYMMDDYQVLAAATPKKTSTAKKTAKKSK